MISADLIDLPYAIYVPGKSEHQWSPAFHDLLGIDKSVSPDFKYLLDIVHPTDLASLSDFLNQDVGKGSLEENCVAYRVRSAAGACKWVVTQAHTKSTVEGQLVVVYKSFDHQTLGEQFSMIHQANEILSSARAECMDSEDHKPNPPLINKVIEYAEVGWFEYLVDEQKTISSSSIKPMMGLRPMEDFTVQYLESIVLDKQREHAHMAIKNASPDKPLICLELQAGVNEVLKWFKLQLELTYAGDRIEKIFGVVQDVTELRETQDKLFRTQEISNSGWFEYDIQNPSASKFSSKWLHIHGIRKSRGLNFQKYLNIVHPEDCVVGVRDIPTFLQKVGPRWNRLEYRIIADGEIRHVSNSSRVVYHDGEPVKIFGVTRDITDTRQTQIALYDNKQLHRILSETSRDVIMLLKAEGTVTTVSYVSDSVESLLGYKKSDILGSPTSNLIHPDDLEIFLRTFALELSVVGASAKFNMRLVSKSLSSIWVEVIANSLQVDGKHMVRLSLRDISERLAFEEQLIHSHNDLDALIRATNNLIFVIDSKARFERVIGNEDRLHIPADEFIGQLVADIWNDPNGVEMTRLVMKTLEEGSNETFNCMHVNKYGKIEWLMVNTYPYLGYNGEKRVSVVIEEITKQKQYEQELEKTVEMERELSKMRANFVTMASHQFRTPLTVIKSNMQLLEALDLEHPVLQKIGTRLTTEVDRLVELMNDLLLIGKAQSNNMRVDTCTFCLRDLISDILGDLNVMVEDNRTLKVSIKGTPLAVDGDYDLLRHSLVNVIVNAFKYSPGKPNPELTIDYTQEEFIHVSIRDFGIGIYQQDHDRIFNDFYRGNNVGNIPGTGLGMSITREFLKLNHCTIEVESEPGLGSIFLIKLPKRADNSVCK